MRVAYNSNLQLIETYIITYRIYVLKNPFNDEVFYVGKTFKGLKERLSGHLSSLSSNGSNKAKNEYIKSIISQGGRPIIEEVEVINGTCYIHSVFASYREFYWMTHYKNNGANLLNHVGIKTDAISFEYEQYLKDIEEEKGNYRNYFCGKTKYGISVYDSEKMSDDGFLFRTGDEHEYEEEDDDEDDEEEDDGIKELTYEPIYDDENPNYVVQSFEEI